MADENGDDEKQPIIVKKVKKSGGGHHGGAWKVAYADFVTAMMAFFLLLWLLNVTTDDQKSAISNYFDPTHPKVSRMQSGAGGIMGGTALESEGALNSRVKPSMTRAPRAERAGREDRGRESSSAGETARKRFEATLKAIEQKKFEDMAKQIEQEIQNNPSLRDLAENILVDVTPEGLRIQLVDQDGESMFASGSARMFDKTQGLIENIAEIIRQSPNDISIRGHTDGEQYGPEAAYTNWELSADRANAARRALLESGIDRDKISNVQGKADTEHLYPDDPLDPRNRRISIILLNQDFSKVPMPAQVEAELNAEIEQEQEQQAELPTLNNEDYEVREGPATQEIERLYEKSRGAVDFP